MKPFLYSVAEHLLNHYSDQMHHLALVFPNKRARLFFNEYLAEITNQPVFSPEYYTITELLEQITGEVVADELTLIFTVYQSYCACVKSPQPFDVFYPYCQTLLADFDDIDKYQVDAKMLFTNLADLKQLDSYVDYLTDNQKDALTRFWNTFSSEKQSSEKDEFLSFWDVLYAIYQHLNQDLKNKNIAYEGMMYRHAAKTLGDKINNLSCSKYAFIGFNALNTCEQQLFNQLQNHNKALFYWDYDAYYLQDDVKKYHEAAFFIREFIKKYPPPSDFQFESDLITKKSIKIFDIPSVTGQIRRLPELLQHFKDIDFNKNNELLIGLGDESLLQPVIHNLPESIGDANVTMGYPGKKTSAYQLIDKFVSLYINQRKKEGQANYYHKDVFSLLQNNLVQKFDTQQVIDSKLEDFKHRNLIYVPIDELKFENNPLAHELFIANNNPKEILGRLTGILEIIIQHPVYINKEIHVVELESISNIHKQLLTLQNILVSTNIDIAIPTLLRMIRAYLGNLSIPFAGEPLKGTQIMGILESRNLDFRNVLLFSMNEGVFPKSNTIPSMIPYSLRKGFGMSTPEFRDAIFSYYFYRLLQRSENVVLVYSSKDDGLNKGEPSRFIQQLIYNKHYKTEQVHLNYSINPVKKRTLEAIPSDLTQSQLENYYGTNGRILSPSAINTYLNCKLQFYYKYIAKLKEPQLITNDIEANVFGSILHLAMSTLYAPLLNQLTEHHHFKNLLKDKETIEKHVTSAFNKEYFHVPVDTKMEFNGNNLIVREVITKYIENIIEYDSKYCPTTILGLENESSTTFRLSNNQIITVGGILDRIDEFNNTIRIIDYKTGAPKLSFTDIEALFYSPPSKRNGAAFQILLYAYILKKQKETANIQPGLFFTKELNTPNYSWLIKMGAARSKESIDLYKQVSDEFENYLDQTLEELFNANFGFNQTEDADYCANCAFREICNR
ncbi:MAG: PD-(D/E)XK nuclease family protein [Bacteroidales bacterium]|nr:PD-(D/E)XK nuclease family protein [Bacteroidales bacterium]